MATKRAENPLTPPGGGERRPPGAAGAGPEGLAVAAAAAMPEKRLQELVRRCALACGWRYFHPWTSIHSPAGYPDCTMTRGGRLVFAELKRQIADPTEVQAGWLEALRAVPGAEVYTWRPSDWLDGIIEEVLR